MTEDQLQFIAQRIKRDLEDSIMYLERAMIADLNKDQGRSWMAFMKRLELASDTVVGELTPVLAKSILENEDFIAICPPQILESFRKMHGLDGD